MCTLEKRGNLFILTLKGDTKKDQEHRLNPPLIASIRAALAEAKSQAVDGSALITLSEGRFFSNGFDLRHAQAVGAKAGSADVAKAELLKMVDLFRGVVADLPVGSRRCSSGSLRFQRLGTGSFTCSNAGVGAGSWTWRRKRVMDGGERGRMMKKRDGEGKGRERRWQWREKKQERESAVSQPNKQGELGQQPFISNTGAHTKHTFNSTLIIWEQTNIILLFLATTTFNFLYLLVLK